MTSDEDCINSKSWRMNNIYRIVDKSGNSVKFKLNSVQQEVLENAHNRNLILKARQLGMSTFSVLYILDEAIFNPNTSCGIVSYSLEHAQHIFKRIIGHAIETLTPLAKDIASISQWSAREITFKNGSFLRVDTTLRGGAYQCVLVSEFGKTCARNPIKAEEVVTGTLQTVPINGKLIIESTGEGNDGYFADMVNQSAIRGNDNLSPLDYKLFFFPWHEENAYQSTYKESTTAEDEEYFRLIEKECNTTISKEQKNWYLLQKKILHEKVKQEFPSTIKEAFLASSDAYYFQREIELAYNENRMVNTTIYDPLVSVYVAMDIGVNDLTVITFFQVVHGEIRIIDFYSNNGQGVSHYANHLLNDKNYIYNTIFLPHDSARRDGIIVENSYEREFRKLFAHTQTKVMVLKRTDKTISISNAKIKLARCVFDVKRTKKLIDELSKYRKKWSEMYGRYEDLPYHGVESNYADSYQYAMMGVSHIEAVGSTKDALKKHRQAVDMRRFKF